MELRPDSHNPEHEPISIDLAKQILNIDGVTVGARGQVDDTVASRNARIAVVRAVRDMQRPDVVGDARKDLTAHYGVGHRSHQLGGTSRERCVLGSVEILSARSSDGVQANSKPRKVWTMGVRDC